MDFVDRFLTVCGENPNKQAISIDGKSVTYAELEELVWKYVALFSQKTTPRIVLCLPQSAHAYAVIFASGLAGGFHSPVNFSSPRTKLSTVAKRLEADFVVTDSDHLATELPANVTVITPLTVAQTQATSKRRSFHRLAYVNFTSGSTGDPKGVMVPRRSINSYVEWLDTLDITTDDRLSQQPNLAFDISLTDILGALCFGASLYPVVSNIDRLKSGLFIKKNQITIWNSTPSAISQMAKARQLKAENLLSLRLVNLCGEPLVKEQLDAIFDKASHITVQNTYGPTEATVAVTCQKLTKQSYMDYSLYSTALGDTIGDMKIELHGGEDSKSGEIIILGPQVADGYWQDAEKTGQVFKEATADGGFRMYKTGDWAEYQNGKLFFRERLDFQVKIRGFRVELGEVAAAIRANGWPVVVVFKHDNRLVAVVEAVDSKTLDASVLRSNLSSLLEAYSIPEIIKVMETMPRNDNDKLDRKAVMRWFESNTLD